MLGQLSYTKLILHIEFSGFIIRSIDRSRLSCVCVCVSVCVSVCVCVCVCVSRLVV